MEAVSMEDLTNYLGISLHHLGKPQKSSFSIIGSAIQGGGCKIRTL